MVSNAGGPQPRPPILRKLPTGDHEGNVGPRGVEVLRSETARVPLLRAAGFRDRGSRVGRDATGGSIGVEPADRSRSPVREAGDQGAEGKSARCEAREGTGRRTARQGRGRIMNSQRETPVQ